MMEELSLALINNKMEFDMEYINLVNEVEIARFNGPGGKYLHVSSSGHVDTSGWSSAFLSPRYYATPPSDGIWEFDFYAEPPSGMVLEMIEEVVWAGTFGLPSWCTGVKVISGTNDITVTTFKETKQIPKPIPPGVVNLTTSNVIIRERLASYDDSFNIHSSCNWLSIKMKKLRHELTLVIEGPDASEIHNCINSALGAGLVAAIIAVYATGGAALHSAIGAFVAQLQSCLSTHYTVKIEDKSHWIYWCT